MTKFFLYFLIFFLISVSHCKNKKERIELKQSGEDYKQTQTKFTNTKLTPELFFKITLDINKISKKYKQINNESQEAIESNIKKMEDEIEEGFKKYHITEDEFNQFGEKNYRELETYLKAHPGIDEKLREDN